MKGSIEKACPECGAANRADANNCRLCGALLKAELGSRPRIQKKILRRTDFVAAARTNRKNTRWLITLLTLTGVCLGYLVGWSIEMAYIGLPENTTSIWYASEWGIKASFIMLAVSMLWTWVAFRSGDKIIMRMTGAREVRSDEEPRLHNVVDEMALAAGLPKPRVFVIETPAMNAFATGMQPSRSAIGVTRGLLDKLNRDELQSVVGHEMGHIANWDIRYATAVTVMVGMILLVSDGLLRSMYFGGMRRRRNDGNGTAIIFILLMVFAILAPLIARMVQMAISRQREFLADASSVRMTRNPLGMISALEKLGQEAEPFKGANRATQHLFIVNPFRNFTEKSSALMATHPPLSRRITRLQNLGND